LAIEPTLGGVKWTCLQARPETPRLNRLAYWSGRPLSRALDYRFKTAGLIRSEVRQREQRSPGSLHHLEHLTTAAASIYLSKARCIWSHHDIESRFTDGHLAIRKELEGRTPSGSEKRAAKYLQVGERLAAGRSSLVLCIAKHECETLREHWGCNKAEFFPMSLPCEEAPQRTRDWVENGMLRLLHLGRIDSLPSFRSLQFLLQEVFPRLQRDVMERLEVLVVGEIRDSQRARYLLSLGEQYPQFKFVGFQEDIRSLYAQADLQVVGSTEATGLRTRIIESFAYGLPVLSTPTGAVGVEGIKDGSNILLAESAESFAQQLSQLLTTPRRFTELAEAGLKTYQEIYSRRAVASTLRSLISRHVN
jgi:glycosyltransferase involved in cell wall biosynthesis